VSTYNRAEFLEEAVESVLGQNYPRDLMEVVVVDDGSTDDSGDRLRKYSDRIRYLYKENGGQASGLNLAFCSSHGEIVMLLDSDDLMEPDKIETLCSLYERYECNALYHNLTNLGTRDRFLRQWLPPYALEGLEEVETGLYRVTCSNYTRFLAPTSGHSYRRGLCEKLFPIPERYRLSPDFYLQAYALMHAEVLFSDKSLGKYRVHPESATADIDREISSYRNFEGTISTVVEDLKQGAYRDRARRVVEITENSLHRRCMFFEKRQGNIGEALTHLRAYRFRGSLGERILTAIHFAIFFILPVPLYDLIRRGYTALGLRGVIKQVFRSD
jgi:hypothetical protein